MYNSLFVLISLILVLDSSEGIDFSLIDIDCGQDDSDLIHLQPSLEPFKVNCSINIQDDAVAHENDESYTLSINLVNFNSSTVSPGRTVMTLSVLDDDGESPILLSLAGA